ncbi:tetratricopeptide repeat protein [Virgibacillus salexigens]|uniref:tetratricopeptide repeat protein n=1 Tax=Virgibacillus salexigens TaxID=61016 RepID=UPI001909AA3B|nr:tetratricopeptide repeat protein [Virgibacillus salexigens]
MVIYSLNQALNLQEEGKLEEANKILFELIQTDNNNGYLHYLYASNCDSLGKERDAYPYYEKAIYLGLDKNDLQGAYLGLGSTYRTLGMYKDSERVLSEGIKQFSNDNALKVFYAMTLYNLNRFNEATELLLKCIVETSNDSNLNHYKRAIEFYATRLNETW